MTDKVQPEQFNLIVDACNLIFRVFEKALLLFSIYDATEHKTMTEEYAVQINNYNFPIIGLPTEICMLFKNLNYFKIINHDLYLIAKIYRISKMLDEYDMPIKNTKNDTKQNNLYFWGISKLYLKKIINNDLINHTFQP